MKKTLISGLLALTLAVGLTPGALAAAATQDEAAQALAALDIMVGDETGDLQLSRSITRAEFTKLVIAASPYRDKAGAAASVAPYPDVPRTHWAAPYVQTAVEAGYVTGSVGKWHLGLGDGAVDWNKLVYPGAKEIGYDYSFIQAATNDRVPCIFIENGRGVNLDPNDPLYVSYKENFPGEPTGKVNRLHQPHVPRVPNERFAGKSGMGPRGDVILEADWCVTEFLKEMDKLGLTENTLVIFTSDNGPVLDDGYQDQAVELVGDHKMAGPLRGGKTSLYDGGTCIPFMLRWPAEVKPGTVSDALVCQMDLLASLSALIGQTYSDKVDSQNTLPVFLGKGGNGRKELVLEGYFNYALRDGDWVMIPPYPDTYGDAEEAAFAGNSNCYQLYNVKEDIGQQVNLAEKEPKRLRQMMMTFERLKRETGKITNF